MTNLVGKSTPTPREVVAYFKAFKCPLCKAELKITKNSYHDVDSFTAYADCSFDIFHYEIFVSWKDPNQISLKHEDIRFPYEERFYIVKVIYDGSHVIRKDNIYNEITIAPLDECGNEDMDRASEIRLKGNIFQFKKFSPERFANRINVMRVFS